MSRVTEKFDKEVEKFKTGIQMFDPDPEADCPYFSIYKDGKLIGRSNREVALLRFLANIKLAPDTECKGYTVVFDDETYTNSDGKTVANEHEVMHYGRLKCRTDFIGNKFLRLLF